MSMLTRYKKSGGFKQLLQLIETSGKAKQDKFLTIVADEDPVWAEAIKQRMLTLDRILGWSDDVLAEVFSRLNEATISLMKHILTDENWEKCTKTFSHTKKRQIEDTVAGGPVPNDAQKSTAIVNVLTEVRTMISEGYIRLDKVDPELIIEDDIEEVLSENKAPQFNNVEADTSNVEKMIDSGGGDPKQLGDVRKELNKLKQKIVMLGNENHGLRQENNDLKQKLDQIKGLAS